MAAQTTLINLAIQTGDELPARQREAVMDYLMKVAFGDPQVHYRVHASPNFRAGFNALNPDLPDFVQDEATRNIIMIGCLHMIDATAALLKFARDNDIQIVAETHLSDRAG
jgi:hypothetical protein